MRITESNSVLRLYLRDDEIEAVWEGFNYTPEADDYETAIEMGIKTVLFIRDEGQAL